MTDHVDHPETTEVRYYILLPWGPDFGVEISTWYKPGRVDWTSQVCPARGKFPLPPSRDGEGTGHVRQQKGFRVNMVPEPENFLFSVVVQSVH